jgi:hypothetical protein
MDKGFGIAQRPEVKTIGTHRCERERSTSGSSDSERAWEGGWSVAASTPKQSLSDHNAIVYASQSGTRRSRDEAGAAERQRIRCRRLRVCAGATIALRRKNKQTLCTATRPTTKETSEPDARTMVSPFGLIKSVSHKRSTCQSNSQSRAATSKWRHHLFAQSVSKRYGLVSVSP